MWRTGVVFEMQPSRAEVVEDIPAQAPAHPTRGWRSPRSSSTESTGRSTSSTVRTREYQAHQVSALRLRVCADFAGAGDVRRRGPARASRARANRSSAVNEHARSSTRSTSWPISCPASACDRRAAPSRAPRCSSPTSGAAPPTRLSTRCRELAERGVTVVRDRDEMRYRDSIQDFMRRLGAGKCDRRRARRRLPESKNCMFELTEIASGPDFAARVLPVVLPDAEHLRPRSGSRLRQALGGHEGTN